MSKQIGRLIKFSQSGMLRLNGIKISYVCLLKYCLTNRSHGNGSIIRQGEGYFSTADIHNSFKVNIRIKLLWVGQCYCTVNVSRSGIVCTTSAHIPLTIPGQVRYPLPLYTDSVYSPISYDRTNVTTTIS